MNQNVVSYLQENKEKYSQDVLMNQLRAVGYNEADIAEGMMAVYGNSGQTGVPVPAAQIKYAGFWIRWVANIIDGFILGIPLAVIIIFFIFFALTKSTRSGYEDTTGINLIVRLVGFVVSWLYFILMTKKYGATLGKRILGLVVISDKSENLSWGQVILRETIGKIVSAVILYIGYIMAGFTQKKQALHDMIASTVVVYKDPEKKSSRGVIIAVVVCSILALVVIIGILASIVLVSLNSARSKAQDAAVKATITSMVPEALIYADENGALTGFVSEVTYSENTKNCSGAPVVNISKDGMTMAIFGKLCSDSSKYYCADVNLNSDATNSVATVDEVYARSGKSNCGVLNTE